MLSSPVAAALLANLGQPLMLAFEWNRLITGVLLALFLIFSVLMILIVLVQKPQGGGLAGAFGSGAGSGQTAFGARTGDALTIATITIFALFLLSAILMIRAVEYPREAAARARDATPAAAPTPEQTPEPRVEPVTPARETPAATPPATTPAATPAATPATTPATTPPATTPPAATPAGTPADTPPVAPAPTPAPAPAPGTPPAP